MGLLAPPSAKAAAASAAALEPPARMEGTARASSRRGEDAAGGRCRRLELVVELERETSSQSRSSSNISAAGQVVIATE